MLFVMYQATFAIITPALISGTFAERMRFPAFALFTLLWSTFIYAPLCHWVWGGGWIGKMGALDFAGGTVVHISSGISALVTAIYLGRRFGYQQDPMPPHNLPLTVVGASLLWVGWFGFNAGSALGSGELAATAFVNTNTAAAAAALGWMLAEWFRTASPPSWAPFGAVAGLVASHPPPHRFVTPGSAILTRARVRLCYAAVSLKPRLGYSTTPSTWSACTSSRDAGPAATGLLATICQRKHRPGGRGFALLSKLVIPCSPLRVLRHRHAGLLMLVNAVTRVRATPGENVGMDLSQHSERATCWARATTWRSSASPARRSHPAAPPRRLR